MTNLESSDPDCAPFVSIFSSLDIFPFLGLLGVLDLAGLVDFSGLSGSDFTTELVFVSCGFYKKCQL